VKFKLDENLPAELATGLRDLGHDADTIADEGLCGCPDPDVVAAASRAGRILLTLDKGIANIQTYPAGEHSGIVLFRPDGTGRGAALAFVRERLEDLLEMDLAGRVAVVGPSRIRLR
jgi:predicted nuclease of predicted toxin-antitoxin system